MKCLFFAAGVLAIAAANVAAQEKPKPLENPCLIKEVLLDYYRVLRDPSARSKWGGISITPFNDRMKTLNGVSCDHIPNLVAGLGGELRSEGESFSLDEEGIVISFSCDPDNNQIRWAHFRVAKW